MQADWSAVLPQPYDSLYDTLVKLWHDL